ncbi:MULTISPECIES: hypothetical protein [Arthrobacter]|uniref:Uncharacterized protein n=2 Tax=Arthrobacter TaxID=1663 RepID=A0ABU9KJ89_9MICC|nr:hypothetical protein [Arthrobacter sp. YJM1]MDP5226864.1 hypothetical protein [Arthrobacter sp. YJM1]
MGRQLEPVAVAVAEEAGGAVVMKVQEPLAVDRGLVRSARE